MIATKLTLETPSKESLTELVQATGPCVTLFLPPYRPGESAEAPATLLKTHIHAAAKKLASRRISAPLIGELLEPLDRLSQDEGALGGSGCTRAIFRSQAIFRQFELHAAGSSEQDCTVGDCFFIRAMLLSLALPATVYVLEVTKKSVSLLACGFTKITRIQLPRGTPQTLDEAMGFDPPDHDLMNRSAAGPSIGTMRGVQFGTGSGRETQHSYLHDFYRTVDRGVNELLRSTQAPLILCGVDQDTTIYRSISACPSLLKQGIHGSPGAALSDAHMLRQVHDSVRFDVERRRALQMVVAKERLGPGRFSTDIDVIIRAAVEGRVSDVYLDENGRRMGTFAGRVFGGSTNWHDEDLLNVAAVETLRRSGAVYALPTHLMPGGSVAAAAFRY